MPIDKIILTPKEINDIIKNGVVAQVKYDPLGFVEISKGKNTTYNYKLDSRNITGPIFRLAINAKLGINDIKLHKNKRYIESSKLVKMIPNLWVCQGNSSGLSGHVSNCFENVTIKNKEKCVLIPRSAYEIIDKMRINVITESNEVIEVSDKNNLFNRDDIRAIWLDNIRFEDLHIFHYKTINSYLKKVQEGLTSMYNRDGERVNHIRETMSREGYIYSSGTNLPKTVSMFINKLISNNYGKKLSNQKYWIKQRGENISIRVVPYYMIYSIRSYNEHMEINRVTEDCLVLNNTSKRLRSTGTIDDLSVSIKYQCPLEYMQSIEGHHNMSKSEFLANALPSIQQRLDFKAKIQKNIAIKRVHKDAALWDTLKKGKFKNIDVEPFNDPTIIGKENLRIWIKKDSNIKATLYCRSTKEQRSETNESNSLAITNFFNQDLSVNREAILSLLFIEIMLANKKNAHVGIEFEKKVKCNDGGVGYLDMIMTFFDDPESIEHLLNRINSDNDNVNMQILKEIYKTHTFAPKNKSSKKVVFEFKSNANHQPKKLKEQCSKYIVSDITNQTSIDYAVDLLPNTLSYDVDHINGIIGINIVFDTCNQKAFDNLTSHEIKSNK